MEARLIQTLSVTVEKLLNPLILLSDRLLLPSYALLADAANSTHSFYCENHLCLGILDVDRTLQVPSRDSH